MNRFFFAVSLLLVAASGYLLWEGYVFLTREFPEVAVLKHQYPIVRYGGPKVPPTITLQKSRPPGWVGLSEISKSAVGAIIVSEDWAFYQHKGYDANQIKEALEEDWEAGRYVRGASTITQQVAKNVFLEQDKNLWRKLKELVLAIRMEEKVGKRKILETYLNIAEWDEGVFGINSAARHYFGKPPSELNAKEGAFLAMLLPSPKRYSISFRKRHLTPYARETIDSILDKMTQARYLSSEERDRLTVVPLSFEAMAY